MKTRRESLGTVRFNEPTPVAAPAFGAQQESTALPTQQQRVMAQLKTAMLALNKKHGATTTNEILNQIIQSITFDDSETKNLLFKPEYSDVVVDTELAVPPLPEVTAAATKPAVLAPFPAWFSYDGISEIENSHFGPLFSMEEERWKIYLSLRNDIVRIYEDMLSQINPAVYRGELFLTCADLRSRLHPKDDSAWVFEMWKFMTSTGIINRGRKVPGIMATATGSGINMSGEIPVPPQTAKRINVSGHTKINCSSCGRECKFVCYKPLPVPESPPEIGEAMDEVPMKDEEMGETESSEPDNKDEIKPPESTYMCHDCTPAYFEKIPIRLFLDAETREQVAGGEFEEVTKDDLKSFLSLKSSVSDATGDASSAQRVKKTLEMNELRHVAEKIMSRITKKKGVIASWDSYERSSNAAATRANPLEILDPSMQEALSGAGQKIRGSVLIEQQVRNMVYSMPSSGDNEEVVPTCPTSIQRATELLVEILKRVSAVVAEPSSVASTPLLVKAKQVDPVHFELLNIIAKISEMSLEVKEEILNQLQADRIQRLVNERIDVKREYIAHFAKLTQTSVHKHAVPKVTHVHELLKQVKVDPSVRLASQNPKQLRLAQL